MAKTDSPIWQQWADNLLALKGQQVRPMTHDEAQIFMLMSMAEKFDPLLQNFGDGAKEALEGSFQFKVLVARLKSLGAEVGTQVSRPLVTFLACNVTSPGVLVMWAHALTRLHQTLNGKMVTMTNFAEAFPLGLPTDDALNAAWDAQKGIGGAYDNFLDTVTA